ncbi:sugar dehydrogenase complex small subunit [Azospirillum doebereinerae]|uniref:Uncharacterized protein n=1 Tax=Azospirillum doebereinerae TaxID=92933 RepID=A0A3S0VHN0_9PROT|nr:sugar dehydrogenase complex small subunit [Azospirillum doebereinerae]RUQ69724.1 hypothetical protein EJ913_15285 [Azospirillum doebereinerae]
MSDAQSQPATGPTRRDVLAGMAGVAAVALAPSTAAAWADETATRRLLASARLTGIELGASYLDLVQVVWATLAPTYGAQDLDRLVRVVNDAPAGAPLTEILLKQGLLPAAQALASTWYTGASAADGGQTVLFYNDALMWRSCAFTKPPATCGGPFGYWEQPYQPTLTAPISPTASTATKA